VNGKEQAHLEEIVECELEKGGRGERVEERVVGDGDLGGAGNTNGGNSKMMIQGVFDIGDWGGRQTHKIVFFHKS
jgi:hypothetical protein